MSDNKAKYTQLKMQEILRKQNISMKQNVEVGRGFKWMCSDGGEKILKPKSINKRIHQIGMKRSRLYFLKHGKNIIPFPYLSESEQAMH